MKSRTRYTIIFAGILIFFILAPLIIFYVGGITLNENSNRYVKTGILSVKTVPRAAEVFLNQELYDTSPVNIRFLEPREYQVEIKKPGYFDWQKNIQVSEGQVSWIARGVDGLHLIKNSGTTVEKTQTVNDFIILDQSLIYLSPGKLVIDSIDGSKTLKEISLPNGYDKITPGYGGNYLLLTGPAGVVLFDINRNSLADLTSFTPKGSRLELGSDSSLYILKDKILRKLIWPERKTDIISRNIEGYSISNNQIYYLSRDNEGLKLFVSSLEQFSENSQQLGGELPSLNNPNILITSRKDIFVYGDKSLYKINDRPELLSASIDNLSFEPETMSLAYTANGQLFGYNFNENRPELVTRFSQPIGTPIIRPEIGYIFFAEPDSIKAWELDTRDRSNNYLLQKTSSMASKILVDNTGAWLYWLEQGQLQGKQIK